MCHSTHYWSGNRLADLIAAKARQQAMDRAEVRRRLRERAGRTEAQDIHAQVRALLAMMGPDEAALPEVSVTMTRELVTV
jgi:hypothetical protein